MNRNIEYCSILRRARQFVASGRMEFVCVAVKMAGTALGMSESAHLLHDLIGERIGMPMGGGQSKPIDHWLLMQGVPTELRTHRNLMIYRLLWIDSMIREFSK